MDRTYITVLLQCWNASLWLPWTIKGIYDFADKIIVNEACWVPGDWQGDTSPDGTAKIIEDFINTEDKDNKIVFNKCGIVQDSAEARNKSLAFVPEDTEWIMLVEADEFYFPEDLVKIREELEVSRHTHYAVEGRFFYFDFDKCKVEAGGRIWRWFTGQRFVAMATMISPGTSAVLPGVMMMHYSYVTPEWTRLKGCMGEDVSISKYKTWWDTVYSQYDGSNLEELYSKNSGGIHVFGGGELEDYNGPHPEVLSDHPLRHKKWKDMI